MKVLYGILAVLALLVAALFLVPPFLDWERLKPEIAERVEAATGRRLWIDGEIAVSLLPAPTLTLTNLRLANLPGAGAPDMARIESVDLALALGPLFGGEIAVTSLALVAPVVELERLADGRPNWLLQGAAGAMGAADERAVRLDSIAVTDGTIVYRAAGQGPPARIERIDAVFSARSLDGPFRGEGAFATGGAAFDFQLATGAIGADGAMPATAELALADGTGGALLEGTVSGLDGAPGFDGTVRATVPAPGALLAALPVALEGVPLAALPEGAFSARATVAARADAVSADDIQIRLGESQATGAVSWRGGTAPSLSLEMALNRLDLDGFPPGAPVPAEPADSPTAAPDMAALFRALPAGLAASLDLAIETVTYRGNVMRQARAILALDAGAVTVRRASALLPGGADVTLAGRIADGVDGPSFAGAVDMAADDLRAVLAWLGLDVAAVPADRLRRIDASADLHARGDRVSASKMDVRIDATRIEGEAAVEFADRPRLSAALAVDAINADAYLPAAGGGGGNGAGAGGGWPALDGVEAELALELGALTYGGARLLGITLDTRLRDGRVTVRRASVADAAGMRFSLAGTARPRGRETTVDLSLEGGARSLSGLAALLDIESGFRPEALGPVSLRGTLVGDAVALAVDVDLAARAAEASLSGTIAALPDRAVGNLALRLHAPDAAELARIAGIAPGAALERLGALAIEAGIEGGPAAAIVLLGAEAAGATLQVAGTVETPFAAPRYQVTADLRHPRAAAFAETLLGAATGVGAGGLHLTGAIAGDGEAVDIADLAAAVGDARATGALAIRLDGKRPQISATLRTGEIDLAAVGGAGAEDAGRRADAPLDLAFLDGLDATLALEADALRMGCCRIEGAALDLAAAEGVLAVRSLGGRLFGGALAAEGSLSGGPVPSADMRFRLSDFDAGAALRAAGIAALTGRATVEGHLSASGATPVALLEGLAGEAAVTARGGTVQGVDLAALARGLEEGGDGFAAAAERALSTGATAIRSLEGRLSVRDGRAVVEDLALVADAGTGEVRGAVDLAAWQVDLAALFRLAEHAGAPPAGLTLTGPPARPARGYAIEALQAYLAERSRPAPLPRDRDAELRDFVNDLLRNLDR